MEINNPMKNRDEKIMEILGNVGELVMTEPIHRLHPDEAYDAIVQRIKELIPLPVETSQYLPLDQNQIGWNSYRNELLKRLGEL